MKRLFLTLTVALSPALAQLDWLSKLDWGGISSNLSQVGAVLSCDPSALTRLDFSQPSLVFRGVYKTTKCVLCVTMQMCGFPDDMLYPASWSEVLGKFGSGR
ncbi:hypothetical protein [Thermus tengchongensis]|uniref:hypothetical protein n=1 Tax=Thermus tengchongensis TaxID=1214928 RepID=UPI000B0C6749|nr:hypothetical protein [Thermus tengchongensis]